VNMPVLPVAVISLSGGTGGMEHDAIKLADLLSSCCDVVLVCKKASFIERLYNKGNYSFRCETIGFLNKNFSVSMFIKSRSIISSYKIKNVVYFGASELKTLYFSFLGKSLNVLVRHGTTKSRAKRDWFHRLVYSCVNYHVAISRHLLGNVKEIVPSNEKLKYEIIYPSFSFPVYKESPFDEGDRVKLIHVGRIVQGKGHRDAILACEVLCDNGIDFELLLLGDGEDSNYVNEIKKIADDTPYGNNIRFAGYVDDVGRYMEFADILLYPSYGEGFGNVFVEAMAHGLSAVTYDNTTFPEFEEMGFVFSMAKDRNIDSLKNELHLAVTDIQAGKVSSESNTKLAAEIFSKDKERRAWCSILE